MRIFSIEPNRPVFPQASSPPRNRKVRYDPITSQFPEHQAATSRGIASR